MDKSFHSPKYSPDQLSRKYKRLEKNIGLVYFTGREGGGWSRDGWRINVLNEGDLRNWVVTLSSHKFYFSTNRHLLLMLWLIPEGWVHIIKLVVNSTGHSIIGSTCLKPPRAFSSYSVSYSVSFFLLALLSSVPFSLMSFR